MHDTLGRSQVVVLMKLEAIDALFAAGAKREMVILLQAHGFPIR
ncbi:MAG TPA: hypothetical protein EYG11_17395 [Candidatus Latescibacteria bacterium]|nr:hypothetical protein [Candidatus Handelsmanbacteria bacterium]HIL10479.1 hypothetical protein [Candidatus Latescibacterota bacterium]